MRINYIVILVFAKRLLYTLLLYYTIFIEWYFLLLLECIRYNLRDAVIKSSHTTFYLKVISYRKY